MPKSADAFRTISEVAEVLDTPAHVLRFWESRFTQIKPVKRAGGRRYYRPADVALLGGIKRLLHDQGLTIRGVQKILKEQGVRHVSELAAPDLITTAVTEPDLPKPGMTNPGLATNPTGPRLARQAPKPHWPETGSPETAQPEFVFPQDPDDAPEAPMHEDAEPDPQPAEVVTLAPRPAPAPPPPSPPLPKPATSAPALSEPGLPMATRLRRAQPAQLTAAEQMRLAEVRARLAALRQRLSVALNAPRS